MKIVLLKNVKGTGEMGKILDVADGYARYLLNNKLAKKATSGAMQEVKDKELSKKREIELAKEQASLIFKRINGRSIDIRVSAGKSGKLHESVTNSKVASALNEQLGVEIDKKKISLVGSEHGIKTFGAHSVSVQLFAGISANVIINIIEINE